MNLIQQQDCYDTSIGIPGGYTECMALPPTGGMLDPLPLILAVAAVLVGIGLVNGARNERRR